MRQTLLEKTISRRSPVKAKADCLISARIHENYNSFQMKHYQHGFHLLDVLIGIALTSTLLMVTVPQLGVIRANSLLKKEIQNLEAAVYRLILLAEQREEDLALSIKNYEFTATPIKNPNEILIRHHLKDNVAFLSNLPTKFPQRVSFYRSGVVSPTTLRLSSGNISCLIKISLRGRLTSLC